jgi:hypothetical protein
MAEDAIRSSCERAGAAAIGDPMVECGGGAMMKTYGG